MNDAIESEKNIERGGKGRPWTLGGEVHLWHSSHTHTHASFTQFPELQPKIAHSFFNDLCFEVSGHCSSHLGVLGMEECTLHSDASTEGTKSKGQGTPAAPCPPVVTLSQPRGLVQLQGALAKQHPMWAMNTQRAVGDNRWSAASSPVVLKL